MYRVKVSIVDDKMQFARQTPNNECVWRNYKFYINDAAVTEADFWVIVTKGRRIDERCLVAPENVILISGEPDSVYQFADDYLKQFGVVVAASQKIEHVHKILSQPALMWFNGVHFYKDGSRSIDIDKNYDYYKSNIQKKTKMLSVMSSNLAITNGHQKRIKFVKLLKEHYGDDIDVFGHGFHDVEDKWDAIASYKYHIVIENSAYPHYWTEKIADPLLLNSYPIYYGCTNINEYFPLHSYAAIDIDKPREAIDIIDKVIKDDYADKYEQELKIAKDLVIDKYNICNVIADVCDKLNPLECKKNVLIKNEMSFKNANKLKMLAIRTFYKMKSKF